MTLNSQQPTANNPRYVLAIDQGTTGTAALLFDRDGTVAAMADSEIRQLYPQPGWVSHDPEEIFLSAIGTARLAVQAAGATFADVAAIGITNQRETTVLWDRATGQPVANAVVWQCRRSAALCEELRTAGHADLIRAKTGLVIDAYFSATKLRWLLDNVPDARRRAEAGELAFGTVESWLLWRLSGGRLHLTDAANASRTMLYNIRARRWDDDLLRLLDIPRLLLPEVRPNSQLYGETDPAIFGRAIPLAGAAGDQQAALFGQTCFRPGLAKNTYGTGSFLLMNVGPDCPDSRHGMLSTVAWDLAGELTYALEGAVFITGAAVQWLRDGLGIIASAAETEALAESVPDNAGVYFVPAFVGLGAPHWDMYARGAILGLTAGASRAHLARATLEAIAYQTRDALAAMEADADRRVPILRVDGGGTANGFLMQFQADQLGIPVEASAVQETTARGAAFLAGLAVGFWPNLDTLADLAQPGRRFEPRLDPDERDRLHAGWLRALERAKNWVQ
jgi:glycerol kinase